MQDPNRDAPFVSEADAAHAVSTLDHVGEQQQTLVRVQVRQVSHWCLLNLHLILLPALVQLLKGGSIHWGMFGEEEVKPWKGGKSAEDIP